MVLTVQHWGDDIGVQQSHHAQYDKQRLLNNQQSTELIKWIKTLTEREIPPATAMLNNFTRELSGKEPGKNWASRWIKAHSDQLISHYSAGLDL
jgi:hypothetical protein